MRTNDEDGHRDDGGGVPSKTVCRLEVVGRVSSMGYCDATQSCLVSTLVNGAHVFNANTEQFYGVHLAAGLPGSSVEHYTHDTIGDDPVTASCFVHNGGALAFGSSVGNVTIVSRCSRGVVGCYRTQEGLPVRTLHAMASPTSCHAQSLLLCTQNGAEVVDVERAWLTMTLDNPCARAVAAVPVTAHVCAVANYDGKVLLHDTRRGRGPFVVLAVPDQITTMAVCDETQSVCVGTVAGRVCTLRCTTSALRERAFGTGKQRAPVVALAQRRHRIAAGDLAGQLALLDAADVADATVYWTAQTLLRGTATMQRRTPTPPPPAERRLLQEQQQQQLRHADDNMRAQRSPVPALAEATKAAANSITYTDSARDKHATKTTRCTATHAPSQKATQTTTAAWLDSEVTAAVLSTGLVWTSFCASNRQTSQVTVLPA